MIPGTNLHQFDVHNAGYFAHLSLNYVDGVIIEIAIPRMPYEQLAEFLEEKCGCYFQEIFGRLNLYLDHLDTNLLEYLSQAITYDIMILAKMEVETKGVEARTSTTEGVEARNSTTEGVEARTRTKDKGKVKVSEDASDVVKTRRCTVEVDNETEYENNDESYYQSDKFA
ncbi:hypothetical protein Tco_0012106 [Tanacetum coccineum]